VDTESWSRPVAGPRQVHWLGDSEGRSELARGRSLKEVRLHTALAIEMACWGDMGLGKWGGHGKTVPIFISQPTHFNKLFVQSTNSPSPPIMTQTGPLIMPQSISNPPTDPTPSLYTTLLCFTQYHLRNMSHLSAEEIEARIKYLQA